MLQLCCAVLPCRALCCPALCCDCAMYCAMLCPTDKEVEYRRLLSGAELRNSLGGFIAYDGSIRCCCDVCDSMGVASVPNSLFEEHARSTVSELAGLWLYCLQCSVVCHRRVLSGMQCAASVARCEAA